MDQGIREAGKGERKESGKQGREKGRNEDRDTDYG